jgi:succinylglutamic semialdehyde dehydrogenase
MSQCKNDKDEEIFGPVLKMRYYSDLHSAIKMSNDTKFGLSAGIVTKEYDTYNYFYKKIKAGIINWNQQLTGATTFAPFGGVKQSGNYRSAGYMSADYCSYPLASFEVSPEEIKLPTTPGMSFNF